MGVKRRRWIQKLSRRAQSVRTEQVVFLFFREFMIIYDYSFCVVLNAVLNWAKFVAEINCLRLRFILAKYGDFCVRRASVTFYF